MSETFKIKKHKDGGWEIFGVDSKTKTEMQIGYIGENLPVETYAPPGSQIQK
jgi:hypothetical protein